MLNEWNADIWQDDLYDTSLFACLLQLSVISSHAPVRSPSSPILLRLSETIAGALQRTCRGDPEGGLSFEGGRDCSAVGLEVPSSLLGYHESVLSSQDRRLINMGVVMSYYPIGSD